MNRHQEMIPGRTHVDAQTHAHDEVDHRCLDPEDTRTTHERPPCCVGGFDQSAQNTSPSNFWKAGERVLFSSATRADWSLTARLDQHSLFVPRPITFG